jgi:magnesium transporter
MAAAAAGSAAAMSLTDSTAPAGKTRLIRTGGDVQVDPDVDELDALIGQRTPFWLDLCDVSVELAGWLGRVLRLHPLVIEDAQQFGERPKVEEFDDYIAVVLYGVGPGASLDRLSHPEVAAPVDVSSLDALGEVHCIVSSRCIVTVHRGDCAVVEDAARRTGTQTALAAGPAAVFYHVADALADSFFPVLEELDDRLDALQAEVIRSPHDRQLTELAAYRAILTPLHKVLVPQTDIFASLSSGKIRVPGAGDDQLPYLRDVHDHLKKQSDLTDSYRDFIAGTAAAYTSVVSNQQNVVMKQLAVISTIFLPLSFLTGFFGQNFGALVGHIASWSAFLIFGIGSQVLAVVLLYLLFRHRGWL